MSFFGKGGLKINKTESVDKTPYTVYYPHSISYLERKWTQPWYQIVSIDPAQKNYALRIERRYNNGWITPIVFDKVAVASVIEDKNVTICNTYEVLTEFLDRYQEFYKDCHFVVIERQLPQNYKATRIAQHSISYFSLRLHNMPLLPSIVEIDAKIKGKILGAPKGINDKQLKTWAVQKARELLIMREDQFSLQVLNNFRNKQDDLCDTVCQLEALFILWGMMGTCIPPRLTTDLSNIPHQQINPITLMITPDIMMSKLSETDIILQNNPVLPIANTYSMVSLLETAPLRAPSTILQVIPHLQLDVKL